MSDKNKKIRIGFKGGDIPVFPPVALIALCGVATILSLSLGRHKFLPIWGDGLVLRIVNFVVVAVIRIRVKAMAKTELDAAGSGIRFTTVEGLATTGIFARSRNPLYLVLLLSTAALAMLVDSLWFLGVVPIMWIYLQFWVIPVEESFLKGKFGDAYARYCSKTPQWIGITAGV